MMEQADKFSLRDIPTEFVGKLARLGHRERSEEGQSTSSLNQT